MLTFDVSGQRLSHYRLLRKDSGLGDAPGRRVVGAKGKYPHCPVYRPMTRRVTRGA